MHGTTSGHEDSYFAFPIAVFRTLLLMKLTVNLPLSGFLPRIIRGQRCLLYPARGCALEPPYLLMTFLFMAALTSTHWYSTRYSLKIRFLSTGEVFFFFVPH